MVIIACIDIGITVYQVFAFIFAGGAEFALFFWDSMVRLGNQVKFEICKV